MAIGTPVTIGQAAQTGTTGGSGGTCVITTSAQVNVGEFIVAFFARNDSTAAQLNTVTDSAGNTYTIVGNRGSADPDPPSTYIAFAKCTTQLNSGGTITGTYLTAFSSTRMGCAAKLTGLDPTSAFDVTASGSSDTAAQASAWTTAASATLAQADEIVFACVASLPSAARTNTPGGSMVEIHDFNSGNMGLATQYQIVTATTAFTATGTLSGVAFWTATEATFKGASGFTDANITAAVAASTATGLAVSPGVAPDVPAAAATALAPTPSFSQVGLLRRNVTITISA